MPGPAFDTFIAPARRAPALWRTLLGTVLMVAIYAGSLAAGGAWVYAGSGGDLDDDGDTDVAPWAGGERDVRAVVRGSGFPPVRE